MTKEIYYVCPVCKNEYVYDKEHACYVCPYCGSEFFPPEEDDAVSWLGVWRDEQRLKKSISKRGGGIRIKKKKKSLKKGDRVLPRLYDT